MRITTWSRAGVAILAATLMTGCASQGGLGGILGSVLGGGTGGSEVSGDVRTIDSQGQRVTLRTTNNQSITLMYDSQTQVAFEGRSYRVTDLEYGDQVTARIQQVSGGYYTDYIQVNRSVSGSGNSQNEQIYQGTVRAIDRTYGTFTLDGGAYGGILVSMPYRARSADVTRYNSLRTGDYVRLYGIQVNSNRIELTRFY